MRRPLIGGEDFEASIGHEDKLKERSWRFTKGEGNLLGLGKGKRKKRNVWKKKINSYVWKGVVHERYVCKN